MTIGTHETGTGTSLWIHIIYYCLSLFQKYVNKLTHKAFNGPLSCKIGCLWRTKVWQYCKYCRHRLAWTVEVSKHVISAGGAGGVGDSLTASLRKRGDPLFNQCLLIIYMRGSTLAHSKPRSRQSIVLWL